MIKIKEERLLTGPATCEDKKNTTKPCHRGDFPPGEVMPQPPSTNLYFPSRHHVASEGTQALCPRAPETEDNDRRSSQVWSDHYLVYIGVLLVLRYIDLIHQRGQALFNAYNDMRKKLGDVRNEIAIIGRKNHDAEQTIKRFTIVHYCFWDLVSTETMAVYILPKTLGGNF